MGQHKNILFLGDSLMAFFDWHTRFPDHTVKNMGIPGETVNGLLGRLRQLDDLPDVPNYIFVMIGTNNLVMEDFSFLPSYEQIIAGLKQSFPGALVTIHGFFPLQSHWLAPQAITRINLLLQKLAESQKIGYLDGCCIFNEKKSPAPYFLEDGIHISEFGYGVWSKEIEIIITGQEIA